MLGKSYSDPQEGLSVYGVLLLANSEVRVRAATAETPAVATMNTKMISIFWLCLRFAFYTLRVRARESLTGIHLLLSSQHSSRASPKPNLPTRMPREALAAG